jgi:hypothetical protein
MTKKEMALALGKALAVLPTIELTTQATHVWYELFKNEQFEDFYVCIMQVVKESDFFPSPSKVFKVLEKFKSRGEERTAETEWEVLMGYARSGDRLKAEQYAKNHYPTFMALRSVTFERLRLADIEKDLPFIKNNFRSVYNLSSEHDKTGKQLMITQEQASDTLKQLGYYTVNDSIKRVS